MTRAAIVLLCTCCQALAAPEPGERPRPETLARACSGCHAADGERENAQVPPLNAMPRSRFLDTMLGFKSGQRRSSIMNRIAKGYQDADFTALADYYELH